MRALLLPLILMAALTACGEARNAVGGAEAAEPAPMLGQFKAMSDDARAVLGDVGVERAGLIFSRGGAVYTRLLAGRAGGEPIAPEGRSFAAFADGLADTQVELRRVVDTAALAPLCGAERASYLALVHDGRRARFTLLVFAGEEAPGARAQESRLCGAYAYALAGPHMREGVVL